jgi:hypothetical protein
MRCLPSPRHDAGVAFVDLVLRVTSTDTSIRGTATRSDRPTEAFVGWLELTAVLARLLAADDEEEAEHDA